MATEDQIRKTLGDTGRAFFESFPNLREVQLKAIPPIAEGESVLVCSATASGKTEAVFAPLIWRLRQKGENSKSKGVRLLAIAPTRALVTDLLRRLESPCARLGWRAAAQTSDYSGAAKNPDLLITTPESFDSMLVKRGNFNEIGSPTGHLLAGVEGVFIDEAHLFDCSVRGDQVRFLLERLKRLRKTSKKNDWSHSDSLQICGASATVSNPGELAASLLGDDGRAIVVSGGRKLYAFSKSGVWINITIETKPESILGSFLRGASDHEISRHLIAIFRERIAKKVLIFCPSRTKCDALGEYLKVTLRNEVDVWVGTHHGSLERGPRRRAEEDFSAVRTAAVLVATSTLEVGIDIGDVDVVVLVGPPRDVSSFLQRVGRGGRREGVTRVIPLAENHEHEAAFAGLLISATQGQIEPRESFRNWGVFTQQIASFIKQNRDKGRPKDAILELAGAVWRKDEDTVEIAEEILKEFLNSRLLSETRNRYFLDGDLIDRLDERPSQLFSNIRSGPGAVAVKDQMTGEIIGHVAEAPRRGLTNIGGQTREIISSTSRELVVSHAADGKKTDERLAGRYPTVPFLITRDYAFEVAKGIGLKPSDSPVLSFGSNLIWFHFGGQPIERLMRNVASRQFTRVALPGIALHCRENPASYLPGFTDPHDLIENLHQVVSSARSRYSRSPFDDYFDDDRFASVASEALRPGEMLEFLNSREVMVISPGSELGRRLSRLIL